MVTTPSQALADRWRAVASELGIALVPERLAALEPEASALKPERFAELVLASACVDGDPVAVGKFVSQYEPEIRWVAGRSLPKDTHDDFVQSVIARLVVGSSDRPPGLGRFLGRGALGGFVRITASRAAIDRLREAGTVERHTRSLGLTLSPQPHEEDRLTAFEDKRQFARMLGEVLGGLRPVDRRVLRMRYLLGYSVADTAIAVQIHERSVTRMVSRLRAEIHNEMVARMQGMAAVKLTMSSLDASIGRFLMSNAADE